MTDNDSKFISNEFQEFCAYWKIKLSFLTPCYPQCNEQAKYSNKIIVNNLKKRSEAVKERWVEKLPGVLWAYRTTPKASTNESPFCLVDGTEAFILTGVIFLMLRVRDESQNSEAVTLSLDLLEEKREQDLIRMAFY